MSDNDGELPVPTIVEATDKEGCTAFAVDNPSIPEAEGVGKSSVIRSVDSKDNTCSGELIRKVRKGCVTVAAKGS